MILILASPIESSIDKVIDWIYYFNPNIKIIRINSDNDYKISFQGDKIFLKFQNEFIDFDDIISFWYRRGFLQYHFLNNIIINDYRREEQQVLLEYLNYKLKQKRHIGDMLSASVNKLVVLEEAQKVGLQIPKTYLIEDLNVLNDIQTKEVLITKTYLESSTFKFSDGNALLYTQQVKDLKTIPKKFGPSLFQNKIDKKIELRAFYLNERIWCMSIFSQNDEKTNIDFRIYNKEKPNRNIPYQLPKEIIVNLNQLMKNLGLNTGSIDLILDKKGNYIFLEVNPIGQFGMVSYPCNYYLEKEIAKYLCYEN